MTDKIQSIVSCSKCKRNIVNGCVSRQRHGFCIVPSNKNEIIHASNISILERSAEFQTKLWIDEELRINPQLEPPTNILEQFIQQGAPQQ